MLVGREVERQRISRLVTGARVGESGVLVLAGEAGIGKTALLEHAVSLAAGMTVLRAAGSESERGVPFGGLLQVLRPAIGHLDRIPSPQARTLGIALGLRDGAGGDRFAVGAATLSLLSRFAEDQALLVAVDDAHLLDRPSAEALTFTARRLVADQIAVLAAVRPDPGSPFADASLPRLPITGISLDAAGELLRAGRHPAGEWVTRLHRDTAGNPLAMVELAADPGRLERRSPEAPIPVPSTLARVFVRRVAVLSPAARDAVLVAAAVGGDLAVTARACEALGVPVAALAEAEGAELLRVTAGRIEFRHPLIGAAVYEDATPDARRRAHAAVAASLGDRDPDRRAWHRCEAALGPDEGVAAELAALGARSRARSGYAVAATAYERAARLTPDDDARARRLVAAGETAWLAGRGERAGALLAEALALGPPASVRARAQELSGVFAARRGSLTDARDMLFATARDLETELPDAAVELLADAAHVCFYLGDAASALRASAHLDRLPARDIGPRARALGTMAAGMALVLAGREGIEQVREGVELLASAGVLADDPLRAAWWCMGALFLRESDGGRHLVAQVVEDLRRLAAAGALPYVLFLVARDSATTDRWASARAEYDEGIRLARETGATTELAASLAGLAWLEARQGLQEACRDHATEALGIGAANDVHIAEVWARYALGDLDLALGRPEAALAQWEELGALMTRTGIRDVDLSPAPECVEALLRLGRAREAREAAGRYLAEATEKGQPWALARAERAVGQCSPADDVDRRFARALAWHADTLDVYEEARTRLAYGSRLRRLRRRAEARDPLRRALAVFEGLGATPWADTAAAELRATGETAHRRGSGVVLELTPQERQIATMLAHGRTTRQAAAAMFLSPKTVEYHLRHVYTKLGISSRAELVDVLTDLPGGPAEAVR